MNFVQAISSGFSNYVGFSGRAIRSEYWYWVLFIVIGDIVTDIVDWGIGAQVTTGLFGLATLLPNIAVSRSGGFTISTALAGGYCSA